MNFQPHIKRTLLQALLITAGLFLSVMANAQHHVAFKGHVVMPGGGRPQITMMVSDSTNTMLVDISKNGRFEFHVPVGCLVMLTVEAAECLTKQITIDTRLAGRDEEVIFDVELERQPEARHLGYAGPVGKVHFAARSNGGRARYVHTRQQKIEMEDVLITAAR